MGSIHCNIGIATGEFEQNTFPPARRLLIECTRFGLLGRNKATPNIESGSSLHTVMNHSRHLVHKSNLCVTKQRVQTTRSDTRLSSPITCSVCSMKALESSCISAAKVSSHLASLRVAPYIDRESIIAIPTPPTRNLTSRTPRSDSSIL